ncbi:MAG: DUF4301 family protein [Nonlabens sp.]
MPASGSGSKMFKTLFEFAENYKPSEESLSAYINRTGSYNLNIFFNNIKDFAFYDLVKEEVANINLSSMSRDEKKFALVQSILTNNDLQLTSLPKALVPLQKYKSHSKNAFEEQLECFGKLSDKFKTNQLNFIVSPQHLTNFVKALDEGYEERKGSQHITFSIQDDETDVLCLKNNRELLLNEEGQPIKQPDGHGVLVSNLNSMEEDLILLSNIGNIARKKYHKKHIDNRKLLMGYTIFCAKRIKFFLDLQENDDIDKKNKSKLSKFLRKYFHIDLDKVLTNSTEGFHSTIFHLLNKPIRIAGVVRNESNLGEAPYWAKNSKGVSCLQLVAKEEINHKIPQQQEIYESSTHFNPVEMVIYNKNHRGEKFDLSLHAEDEPSILVEKSHGDHQIKYLEKPGLWNAGMRNYLTMFIQIKSGVFNPVEEITDVLKKYH